MVELQIARHKIGTGLRPFVIAEVGQAHDGSLGMAHCFIEAAAAAGADAVKFQTHIANAESTIDEPFRVKFSMQDRTRYDYWQRMEFTTAQWIELAKHAEEKDLVFLSSPFSVEAVKMLIEVGVPAWKIGSGEFWSDGMLDLMVETQKPILISTGMSRWSEIEEMAAKLMEISHAFALLQCTSSYPSKMEEVGLNVIDEMRTRFKCPIGLSDHSGTIFPSIAALSKGAALIEVHFTMSRDMFGPDVSSSLTTEELSLLVKYRDALWTMLQNPVDKDKMAENLLDTRELFSKSIALNHDMKSGELIKNSDLCTKKPGTGIHPKHAGKVVGKTLVRDVSKNRLLKWDDLNET